MKAVVIGSGIGGLSAAIALRRAGVDVTIYEQAAAIREVGAGLSLWPNATKALAKLGLASALQGISIPQLDGGIHNWQGQVITAASDDFVRKQFGMPVIIAHRAELLAMLNDAAGIPVNLGIRFKSYQQDGHSVTATFENGQTVECDMLIGADGIKSAVRAQMSPTSQPRYAGYTAWRGIAHYDYPDHATYWGESWGCGARFGLVPMNGKRVYWFAVQNAPPQRPAPAEGHKAYLLKHFSNWHHPIADLLNATDESAILHNDIHDIEPLTSWLDGRVALVGDAAHAMTPNLGQGACQAIEDAVALGNAIAASTAVPAALARYQAQRITRANSIVVQSRRIGLVGQLSNPLACRMRDTLFRLLPARIRNRQIAAVVGYEI